MRNNTTIGAYATSNPHTIAPFGYPLPAFRDAQTVVAEDGHYWQREMTVEGKRFTIRSFFQMESTAKAMEKLLQAIDSDALKKDC